MASSYNAGVFAEQGGDKLVVDSAAGGAIAWGTDSTNVSMTGCVRADAHTVTDAQATANKAEITTGLTTVEALSVMILRSGKVATSDAAVSESSGTLTVADGSTYDVTKDDVIHWIAIGT